MLSSNKSAVGGFSLLSFNQFQCDVLDCDGAVNQIMEEKKSPILKIDEKKY